MFSAKIPFQQIQTVYTNRSKLFLFYYNYIFIFFFLSSFFFTIVDKGHYTSFCRDADRTTWIFYNDKEVGVASPEDVLVSQGFLLFYEIVKES